MKTTKIIATVLALGIGSAGLAASASAMEMMKDHKMMMSKKPMMMKHKMKMMHHMKMNHMKMDHMKKM